MESLALVAVESLNSIGDEEYRERNWWDDVVSRLPGADLVATDEADPYGRSDLIVFTDGSRAVWNGHAWVLGREVSR